MKKQSVFNGLMVCILIVAMLPVSGPVAARAAPEAVQTLKADEITETSAVPQTPTAPPTIAEVSPLKGTSNMTTTITVLGSNFATTGMVTVTLGSHTLTNVRVFSPTVLMASVPMSTALGTFAVTVTNPDGQNGALANAFSVVDFNATAVNVDYYVINNGAWPLFDMLVDTTSNHNLWGIAGTTDTRLYQLKFNQAVTGTSNGVEIYPEPYSGGALMSMAQDTSGHACWTEEWMSSGYMGCLTMTQVLSSTTNGIAEFQTTGTWRNTDGITFDPVTNSFWFSQRDDDKIVKLVFSETVPNTSRGMYDYPLPGGAAWPNNKGPHHITSDGKGNIWTLSTRSNGGSSILDTQLWKLVLAESQPGTSNGFYIYTLPDYNPAYGTHNRDTLKMAADGTLWATTPERNLYKISPSRLVSGTSQGIEVYHVPSDMGLQGHYIGEIEFGKDGRIWLAANALNKIISFDPSRAISGTTRGFTEYPVPFTIGGYSRTAMDAAGNLYFVGQLANNSQVVAKFALSAQSPFTVAITGPTTGTVNTAYTFTATVSPPTATLPITYTWQASGQVPITHATTRYTDTALLTWSTPGAKVITVTATNANSVVTATQSITLVYPTADIDWIARTTMPISVGAVSYAVLSGTIYIIGGGNWDKDNTTTVQRYTPTTGSWEVDTNHGGTLAPLPQPRALLVCGVISSKIHCMGGWENGNYRGEHFIYDPVANSWSIGPSIPQYPIGQFGAVVNNKMYIFGGWWGTYKDYVFEYSEATGWTSKSAMPTPRTVGTAAVYNGKIYAIGGEGGQPMQRQPFDIVEVYDPATDTWTTGYAPMPSPQGYMSSSGSPVADGVIYVVGPGTTPFAYIPLIDSWQVMNSMPAQAWGVAAINGSIYAIGPEHTFQGVTRPWPMLHHDAQHTGRSPYVGPQRDEIAWTYRTGGPVNSSPAIGKDGILYVGSNDKKLYAINPDGTFEWAYTTGDGVSSSPAIGQDGTVYVGSWDRNVYAIRPDGTLYWTFLTGGAIYSSPVLGHDGTIYIGSNDGNLYALSPTGTLKCSYSAGAPVNSSPVIGPDGVIYVGSSNGRLNAVYPNCAMKWTSTPPSSNGVWTNPAVSPDGSTVYYGADDGYLYATSTITGYLKWRSPWTYGGVQSSPAVGCDGTIYVGTQYGSLWALDPVTGSLKWDYYMTLSAWSSPAIGACDTIYFATDYGAVFAMNPDGTVKWNHINASDGHFRSSPAIGKNGALHLGSSNGNLYAFGPKSLVGGPTIGYWQTTTPLPKPVVAPFAGTIEHLLVYHNRVYVFGSLSPSGWPTYVYYSNLNADGSLGPWVETTSLPQGDYFDYAVVNVGKYVYYIAGADGDIAEYYAEILPDGSLGTWIRTVDLLPSRQNFAAATAGDYVYVSGGNAGGTSNLVKFTSVKPGGALNSWTDTTPLPEAIEGHTMVAHDRYLYVLAPNRHTYYAPISADGTVISWTTTISLPQTMTRFAAIEYNDYLYLLDGGSRSSYFAPLLSNGSLGQWQATTMLPERRSGLWTGAANGFLYAVGGNDGSADRNTVYYAKLQLPPVSVSLNGPMTGYAGLGYTFTATVNPTATPPLAYVWTAIGQSPVTHTSDLSDTVNWTWTTPGLKTITVTAGNTASVVATKTINLQDHQPVVVLATLSFDNDLTAYADEVIERIRQGTAAPSTAVATLLIDGAGIGDTRVLEIAGGVITQTNVPTFTGELDTADPYVIAAFLTWARAQHPDARTVVAMLGHGAGLTPEIHPASNLSGFRNPTGLSSFLPLPMSRDATPVDVTSGTYLSTPELGRALDAATNHGANPFDVLFLDQCFGGGLDTLVEIRAAASVFVASPNYAWGAFAYDRYLPHFTPAATPENMAQAIVDEYEAALDDTHPNAIFWLRGSDIVTITNAVSNLGDALRIAPAADVLAATLNSQFVDTTLCANDWQLCPPDEEIGLRSFAAQLQSRAAVGSAVYTTAGEVLTALSGVHSNTAHAAGAPWPKPEVQQWNLADLGPTVLAPLTKTLAASGDIWRASLYTSTAPLTAILSWAPTQTVVITTPWASTINSGWARFLSSWYGPLTPTIGLWCNSLPPALVVTGTDSITLTAQGGLVSARLTWMPVVTSTAVDYAVYVLRPNDGTWELAATVPLTQTAFTHPDLPSGVYRYFVAARNDQAQVVARSDEAAIDVGVTSIDPGYGLNSVPTMVYLRGSGFEAPITVTMGSTVLQDVLVIDPHTLHVVIPAGLTPGVYDVTVSTAAGQVMMPNAFRVLDAVVVDDLVSSPDQLATNPLTVRGNHTTTIEFAFQRLGGKFTLDEVTVAIRVNGVLLDNAWTEPVSPNSTASASPVSWLPPAKGDYEVCAIIDPANLIPESDETNNTVCNTITVLPVADDMVPPVVNGFVIDHDAPVTTILTATLTVTATDPLPNSSGVKCVKFYEFEWSQGVRRWLPVTRSGCVDYAASPTDYPWQLLNIPGIRYMEAWAQDNADNISLAPGIDTIDLAPTAQTGAVAQNGVIFYRFYVRQGQPVVTSLVSLDGDADLYVWGPGNQLWHSNNQAGLEDRVAFNAPITGTYQIEVHGYTAAHYRLTLGGVQPGMPSLGSPSSLTATHNADKPLPDAPAVPLDSWPNGRIVRPPEIPTTSFKVYLPIAVR